MPSSIVIPVYNGARTIEPLVRRLLDLLGEDALQIVLVNDGSVDDSDRVCRSLQARFPSNVVYLQLAKNFGEHNAVMAGLHHATGNHVVIMDDDFQNPPEEVRRVIEFAKAGDHDVVYTHYAMKRHDRWRNLGSRFNNSVADVLLGKPRGLYLSSFKCLNRFLVGEVVKYSGPFPYIDGLILRSTSNIGTILVRHDPRAIGRSNYTLGKLARLWLNMFVNFSVLPLRVSTFMGLSLSGLGILMGIAAVIEKLRWPETPVGWASIMVTLLIFSGIQLVMLGILGEYLGRHFLSGNQTPQFVVRNCYGTPSTGAPTLPRRTGNRRSRPEAQGRPKPTSESDLRPSCTGPLESLARRPTFQGAESIRRRLRSGRPKNSPPPLEFVITRSSTRPKI